ncbi:MAG: DUF4347 domain-containing protein, partial [Chlamydiia bacterium]|nr:DUF4347 domain-containing protein [Chlamydiia bacterium]
IGQGDAGVQLLTTLAEIMNASGKEISIFASDDSTGAASLGGDWVLEVSSNSSVVSVTEDLLDPDLIQGWDDVLDAHSTDVLILSSGVADSDLLAAAVKDDVLLITYDPASGSLADLSQRLSDSLNGAKADSIAFLTDAGPSGFWLEGNNFVSLDTLNNADMASFWHDVAGNLKANGSVNLLGCSIASTVEGQALLSKLGDLLGTDSSSLTLHASDDLTGSETLGADWLLEYSSAQDSWVLDAQAEYFDANLLSAWEHALGTLSISSPSITEGDSGFSTLTFVLTRATPINTTASVSYTTTSLGPPGSVAVNSSGTVNWAINQAVANVNVQVYGDTIYEGNQSVVLTVSNFTGGVSAGQITATGTIIDNETAPTLSINDVSVTEGDSGTQVAQFTVSTNASAFQTAGISNVTGTNLQMLSPAPASVVQGVLADQNIAYVFQEVQNYTLTSSINVNVVGPGTYTGANSGIGGTIAAGTVVNSYFVHLDQTGTAAIRLNNFGSLTFGGTILGVILHDTQNIASVGQLGAPGTAYDFGPFADLEPLPGDVNGDQFTILADNKTITFDSWLAPNNPDQIRIITTASSPISFDYATQDNTATAPSDYVATSGTATIAPGSTSTTVPVTINSDVILEGTETFFVNLSNPVGALISDGQGVGTIFDNDFPGISINDVSITEGDSGTQILQFIVSTPVTAVSPITFDYVSADGTATAGSDYVAVSGTGTILTGTTNTIINVTINSDTVYEGPETFFINLSNPVNSSISDGQGVG